MKKLIAVSSLLALVLAGSGLFALDIPVGDEGGKFTLDSYVDYEFDIVTDTSKPDDNDKSWIEEVDPDDNKQGRVTVSAGYEGDNYAFGVGFGIRRRYATGDPEFYTDTAWGKYYLLDKQLSIRGGGLAGDWGGTIWDTFEGSWSDDQAGVQLAFAPSALTGLSFGLSLPVPFTDKRTIVEGKSGYYDENDKKWVNSIAAENGNWGPTYPFANLAFGLRLNQTIPGLDFSTEVKLKGKAATNGETGEDEGEGDFQGANLHFVGIYTFAPISFRLSVPITGLAAPKPAGGDAPDPITKLAARLIFDIPNAEGSSLDLGDPFVQLKLLPNANAIDASTPADTKSFKDIEVGAEWGPSYKLSDQLTAYLYIAGYYRIWEEATKDQEDYPLTFWVRPGLGFKFAPNATLLIRDRIYFARQTTKEGLRNEVQFRFNWAF
ncbi:MAG: hypothetical protein LBF87_07645 [Treponema sp.]|jgi:hypothetical protein|nr:hypothetical protein [Treponema sp.]